MRRRNLTLNVTPLGLWLPARATKVIQPTFEPPAANGRPARDGNSTRNIEAEPLPPMPRRTFLRTSAGALAAVASMPIIVGAGGCDPLKVIFDALKVIREAFVLAEGVQGSAMFKNMGNKDVSIELLLDLLNGHGDIEDSGQGVAKIPGDGDIHVVDYGMEPKKEGTKVISGTAVGQTRRTMEFKVT